MNRSGEACASLTLWICYFSLWMQFNVHCISNVAYVVGYFADELCLWQLQARPRLLKMILPDYERAVRLNSGTAKRRESAKALESGEVAQSSSVADQHWWHHIAGESPEMLGKCFTKALANLLLQAQPVLSRSLKTFITVTTCFFFSGGTETSKKFINNKFNLKCYLDSGLQPAPCYGPPLWC